MAQFFIRVVLHDATAQDYVRVQTALAAKGIYDTIEGSNGRIYRLPPGEYRCDFISEANDVRDLVRGVLALVYDRNAVFVAKYTEAAWFGLDQVKVGASGYASL